MEHVTARAFVNSWVTAWNAHDLDAVLTHFADDVTFRSPVAIQLLGGDGVIRGKDALRAYWAEGLRRIPDLRFEVLGSYVGVNCLVINYRNQKGGLVNEVLILASRKATKSRRASPGSGRYGPRTSPSASWPKGLTLRANGLLPELFAWSKVIIVNQPGNGRMP